MVLRWRWLACLGLFGALIVLAQNAIADARSPANLSSTAPSQQRPVASGAGTNPARIRAAPAGNGDALATYLKRARRLTSDVRQWLAESYQRSPEAVAGLAILAILPLLTLPAGIVRLTGALKKRLFRHFAKAQVPPRQDLEAVAGLSTAWLEVALSPGSATRLPLDRPMLRIGRHDENDLCLPNASVRGYHALIYWSPEEAFQIRDLTAAEETGVLINGQPVGAAPLRKGDLIELGDVRMRFATVHA